MKLKLILPLLIIGLLGCGQVEEHAIYDTDDNPNDFPTPAIDLLVGLENGQLSSAEAITTSFGDLYTEHSELLDNVEWKAVIDRLGGRFAQIADSLKTLGVGAYASAGEYYQLASFARPDDPTFRRQAALFNTWLTGLQDGRIDLSTVAGETPPELTDLVDIIRYFLEADATHREFYQTFLAEPMKHLADHDDLLDAGALEQLSPADRELLSTAGLTTP